MALQEPSGESTDSGDAGTRDAAYVRGVEELPELTIEQVLDRLAEFGPVQMWSFVFDGNQFKGEILPELERLKKAEVIRLIDLLVVRKDSTGAITTLTSTDLDWEEASHFGSLIGALMGWGAGGAEGIAAGAISGAAELADGHAFGEETRFALTESVPPGNTAALALVEHVWAKPLQAAIARAHGVEVSNDWLKMDELIARGLASAGAEDALETGD
jgi:uncharacterized membrane protein